VSGTYEDFFFIFVLFLVLVLVLVHPLKSKPSLLFLDLHFDLVINHTRRDHHPVVIWWLKEEKVKFPGMTWSTGKLNKERRGGRKE
jgi:hypothetical protein